MRGGIKERGYERDAGCLACEAAREQPKTAARAQPEAPKRHLSTNLRAKTFRSGYSSVSFVWGIRVRVRVRVS